MATAPIPGRRLRLIVRRGAQPSLSLEGLFTVDELKSIRAHRRGVIYACCTLRYLDEGEVTRLASDLAARLVGRLGVDAVRGADWGSIPSGGDRVLRLLAAELGVELGTHGSRDRTLAGPLILVDDCALSGARLGQHLRGKPGGPDQPIVVVHLLSHPGLRAAVKKAESRVLDCLAAGDLQGHGEVARETTGAKWGEDDLPRYWAGLTEHPVFPWNEPDRRLKDPVTGRMERAWRVVPPALCEKNAPAAAVPIPIEILDAGPEFAPPPAGERRAGRTYRMFERVIRSEFPHRVPLPAAAGGEPDLRIEARRESSPRRLHRLSTLYISPYRDTTGAPRLVAHETEDGDLFRFASGADFLVRDDRIEMELRDGCDLDLAEIHLLGVVLAWWLERRGIVVLHASGVASEGGAVGFIGRTGMGKSAAAGCLVGGGWALLADDALAIEPEHREPLALPSHPNLRLWPSVAQALGIRVDDLTPIHPAVEKGRVEVRPSVERSAMGSAPLKCLFVLGESGDPAEPDASELSPSEALLELIRHSFLGRMLSSPEAHARRLPLLSRIASAVPMRKLSLPSGWPERDGGAALFDALAAAGLTEVPDRSPSTVGAPDG